MFLNVAGAVVHYDRFIREIPVLKILNRDTEFTVYDGPNLCQWNGGRINRDITLTPEMVDRYNKFGISVSLTFTNPFIDLDDKVGNDLLEMIHHYGQLYNIVNKVVLINDELREYIRGKYNFQIICSTTGHSPNVKVTHDLISRYKMLEDKFDYIVPKFELVFQPDFYNNINTSKYELLVNDTCIYECPYYLEHFQRIARQNQVSKNPWQELGYEHCYKTEECWLEGFNPDIGSDDDRTKYGEMLGMDYTPYMIIKAKSLGYKSFKISGRENHVDVVMSHVKRFLR